MGVNCRSTHLSTNLLTNTRFLLYSEEMAQVRISETSHELLRSLSTVEGKSMQDVMDQAIENYRRKAFLEGLNEDYQRLRSDEGAWKEHSEETALWDNVLMDGLGEYDPS